MILKSATVLLATFLSSASVVSAQDPIQVDPKHYKLEFENEQVRVLRIIYGPHEKSVMHHHADGQIVYLTDIDARSTMQNGNSQEEHVKAGATSWGTAETHKIENLSDKPFEAILIELKTKR
jgi:quercetin dioxygenase-like cupin family protein